MFEGDVDLLHSLPVKGNERCSRERAVYGERARSPASVTSAGLIARLESTPKSANLLYRGPRRSAARTSTFRVGVAGKSRDSKPLELDEETTKGWGCTAHRGPKRDTPFSREHPTGSMGLTLADFKFCDSFGPTTSLLVPSSPTKQTPSPAHHTTHLHLRRTDEDKRPSWKFR